MPAVHERSARSMSGLLGKPPHNLRLRVVGPDGESRTLRIKSRKYTIGADASCSLRLCGLDLHPVHCMIIRGARGTVVRSLSPGNQLNGTTFRDAPLETGDRLRLGSFDFLVLPTRRRRPRRRSPGSFDRERADLPATLQLTTAIEGRMNRLETQLIDLQRHHTRSKIGRLRRTIDQLSEQLEQQQFQHSQERRRWQNERDDLAADVSETAERLQQNTLPQPLEASEPPAVDRRAAQLTDELSALSSQLADAQLQQHGQQEQCNSLERQLGETRERIAALEAELAAYEQKAAGFAAERAAYEAKTGELTESLGQLSDQLEQQQAAQAAAAAIWQQARVDIETQLEATKHELQATSQQLEQVEADLQNERSSSESARQSFEQERARLQQEKDELSSRLAERETAVQESAAQVAQWERECTALADRAEELEQHIGILQQATLDSAAISDSVEEAAALRREMEAWQQQQRTHQKEWDGERTRLADQLGTTQQEFAREQQRRTELEQLAAARDADLAAIRSELQETLAARAAESVDTEHLRRLESELEKLRAELAFWKQQAEQETPPAAASQPHPGETFESEPGELPTQCPGPLGGPTISLADTTLDHAAPDAAPVDTAKVLASFEQSGIDTANGGEFPLAGEVGEPESVSPTPASVLAEQQTPVDEANSVPTAEDAGTEEEAIEDYMNRLLARVRGEPSAIPKPQPNKERAPITEEAWEPDPQPDAEFEGEPEAVSAPEADKTEYIPRRAAPERSDSLAAMRSLANNSTRSAIASHAKRNWMEVAKYQICGAAMGLTGGIVSFVILENRPLLAAAGILAGLLIAGCFGAQALAVRRQLLLGADGEQTPSGNAAAAAVEVPKTAETAEDQQP